MKFTSHLLFGLSSIVASVHTTRPAITLASESIAYRRTQLAAPDLRPGNKLSQYAGYNFGPLWMETANDAVLGFIGPDYQRLRVKILTVRHDTADPTRYLLTGKTQVAGHISSFSGVLVLRQVRELRKLATRIDETVSPARREGILLADYELREQADQPKSGVFRGIMETDWYVDKRGRLRYDAIRSAGDGFCNNQFVGTWTSYATKKALCCNWGDYRIPNSGAFDVGAGEFSPDPKYYPKGWHNYAAIWGSNDAARVRAEQQEQRIWWQ
jgi:hypothetical protein